MASRFCARQDSKSRNAYSLLSSILETPAVVILCSVCLSEKQAPRHARRCVESCRIRRAQLGYDSYTSDLHLSNTKSSVSLRKPIPEHIAQSHAYVSRNTNQTR